MDLMPHTGGPPHKSCATALLREAKHVERQFTSIQGVFLVCKNLRRVLIPMKVTSMNTDAAQKLLFLAKPHFSCIATMTLLAFFAMKVFTNAQAPASAPIRALLITGGRYHDYNGQSTILTEGISARANVQWTVFHDNGMLNDGKIEESKINAFFGNPDWSKGFDVVVYNDSFQRNATLKLVKEKLAPHLVGLPAVIIHGSVHTHVDLKTDEWREFVGIRSPKHGPAQPITVNNNIAPQNSIMQGFPATWVTVKADELYDVDEVLPTATPLAQAHDVHTGKDYCVVWTNLYGPAKTRVFGTSLPHCNVSMETPVYLDLVTRGLLWSVNKLDAAHLHPAAQVMLDGSKVESTFVDQTSSKLTIHQ